MAVTGTNHPDKQVFSHYLRDCYRWLNNHHSLALLPSHSSLLRLALLGLLHLTTSQDLVGKSETERPAADVPRCSCQLNTSLLHASKGWQWKSKRIWRAPRAPPPTSYSTEIMHFFRGSGHLSYVSVSHPISPQCSVHVFFHSNSYSKPCSKEIEETFNFSTLSR